MAEWKVIQGDCLDVLRSMPDASVDAVVTDPPYGVDLEYASYEDSFANWSSLIAAFLPEAIRVSRGPVVVPTSKLEGERVLHDYAPLWRMCWFKGACCTRSPIGFKDWEPTFVFGKRPHKQVHDHFHVSAHAVRKEVTGHPCPKPIGWATWLVERMCDDGATVLDPFCGSGTTGVACVQTGRNFIGIELDPGYCEIARRRIADAVPLCAEVP